MKLARKLSSLFLFTVLILPVAAAVNQTGTAGSGQAVTTQEQPYLDLNYIIALNGIFPTEGGGGGTGLGSPYIGEIRLFAGNFVPGGWAHCNGALLNIASNPALFAILGTTYGGNGTTNFALPDLRGRIPIGASATYPLGTVVGSAAYSISADQMPSHSHTTPGGNTGSTGGSTAISNMQPSLALNFLIATQGIYDTMSEVVIFAGNFAPGGWAICQGQLLPIAQNAALFSKIGTSYGGNGTTNFALPDLRGRTAIGAGQGPGLTSRVIGEIIGTESFTLTTGQLPVHSHTIPAAGSTGTTGSSNSVPNMQPSLAMNCMIQLFGIFPSSGSGSAQENYMATVTFFAGYLVPDSNWAPATGSIVSISENDALFAILGTMYGGDGQNTFAYPDTRGRAIRGTTTPGGTLGLTSGVESYTLITSNLPSHTHSLPVSDSIAPVISGCPSNITANTANGQATATVTWTAPTASDNIAVTSFTSTHNSGASFPVGTTTVTYTALDAAGNSSTCSFTVTVVDNQAPVISGCPSTITANTSNGLTTATVTWTAPTASDNVAVSSFTSTHNSGATFSLGTTTVTYTASDAAGNTSTCSFTVTVVDNQAPVFSGCPSNMTVNTANGLSTATVTWSAPTASDNVAVTSSSSTHNSGATFSLGSTTVTYTASDAAGNSSTCSFTVTVVDDQAPVISGCPSNMTVNTANGLATATVTWTAPTASDNVAVTNLTSTHNSGAIFPAGTTTVTYTATDAAANSSTCSFTVTVVDDQMPVISGCPTDISVVVAAGITTATVTWSVPTASDNVGVTSFISTYNSGASFPLGTTTVTYTAGDAANNEATCSFTITVASPPEGVIYVNAIAIQGGDGTTWGTAFRNLAPALTAAQNYVTAHPGISFAQIWIAAGTYSPGNAVTDTFTVPDKVILFGGFAGNEIQVPQTLDPAHVTILDGGSVNTHVVTIPVANNGVAIDGVTIQNGKANGATTVTKCGGGLYATNAVVILSNVVFKNNTAALYGGAAYYKNCSTYIMDSTFTTNTASYQGGGVYTENTDMLVENSTFTGNNGTYFGGGLATNGGSTWVYSSTFINNKGPLNGGGIWGSGTFTVENSVFSGNTTTLYGAGAYLQNATNFSVNNCTFISNSAGTGGQGGGFSSDRKSTGQIRNSIFWNNAAQKNKQIYNVNLGFVTVANNLIQGAYNPSTGTIIVDPKLDSNGRPTSLTPASINTGVGVLTEDRDGNTRNLNEIGAFARPAIVQ
ncbi:MAG: HYR domain-containing protein [Verrucomicrobiota bacterium]|nr:HYR domain-containing protein [Verrucomicrobiota bacterium]